MPRPKLHDYNGEKLRFARTLRKEMSISERWLWHRLRDQKTGFRFRTQVQLGAYVLDFYCPEVHLCVEVDGEQHSERVTKDLARDQFLLEKGIHTIRIPSIDLFKADEVNIAVWVDRILDYCEKVSGREAFRDFIFESEREFGGPKGWNDV